MTLQWIECNLRWSDDVDYTYPPFDYETLGRPIPINDISFEAIMDEMEQAAFSDPDNPDEFIINHFDRFPEHQKKMAFRRADDEYNLWADAQPAAIQYEVERRAEYARRAAASNGFCQHGLNQPGTLVEMDNGNVYLIGDINCNRGVCDDCTAFDATAIVKRYAILYKHPTSTSSKEKS